MMIVIDLYTVAGLAAVLMAYPPVFKQIWSIITTVYKVAKVMKRYADLPDDLRQMEIWRDDHISAVGLHNGDAH